MADERLGETAGPVAAELNLAIRAGQPVLYLVTWEEERALEVLESVARSAGRRLYVWTHGRGLGVPRVGPWDGRLSDPTLLLDALARSEERALYVLLDFHPFLANPLVGRRLKDVSQAFRTAGTRTVVLVSHALVLPSELEKDVEVLDLPLPRSEEFELSLQKFSGKVQGLRVLLSPLEREVLVREARGLTLKEFSDALAKAMVSAGALDGRAVLAVREAKRQLVRKSPALELVPTDEGLANVGGLDNVKRWLETRVGAFSERARSFGLPSPRGMLLVGVQGGGKSLCARAVSTAWSMPLLRLDLSALFAGLVGATEANLRTALRLVEGVSPCVLWIDELERGLSGAENGASDGGTASRVLGAFLTWMQEKKAPVFVVATANEVEKLPPELLRKGRFDETFFVDLPGIAERAEILRIHLQRRGRDPARFDLETLAERSDGFSGAELEQAIIAGLFLAFEANKELETEQLLRALSEAVPLSRMMSERVDALRKWAATRARPASSLPTEVPRVTV